MAENRELLDQNTIDLFGQTAIDSYVEETLRSLAKWSTLQLQKEIIRKLNSVTTSSAPEFASRMNFSMSYNMPIHRWFKYREGYSPELVNFFTNDSDVKILDPFCGSGTTLVRSSQLGINSTGVDINPLSVFVARVKTAEYDKEDRELFKKSIQALFREIPSSSAKIPELKVINKIFHAEILDCLLRLKPAIDTYHGKVHDLLFLGWLAILESVSNTKKEGNGIKYRSTKRTKNGYIHIPDYAWQRKYFGQDKIKFVRDKLRSQYEMMLQDLEAEKHRKHSSVELYQDNATELDKYVEKKTISTTIFSPPYVNAFDYFEIFKVELWMGNFITNYDELRRLRRNSVGSLWKVNASDELANEVLPELGDLINLIKKEKSWDRKITNMITTYFYDMQKVLSNIYNLLRPQGKCVIVVGNSAYSNVLIPTDLILAKIAMNLGFESRIAVARHLTTSSQQRKYLKPLLPYMRESMVILQKSD